jgi:hypothetical protein
MNGELRVRTATADAFFRRRQCLGLVGRRKVAECVFPVDSVSKLGVAVCVVDDIFD